MNRTQWRQPVHAGGLPITDALEAIHFMDQRWPRLKGKCFSKAHSACLAALDGREPADMAREKFAMAVDEAELHPKH